MDSFKSGHYFFISMFGTPNDLIPSYYWVLDVEKNKELNVIKRESYLSYEILDIREEEENSLELKFISCSLEEVFISKVNLSISNDIILLAKIKTHFCLKS